MTSQLLLEEEDEHLFVYTMNNEYMCLDRWNSGRLALWLLVFAAGTPATLRINTISYRFPKLFTLIRLINLFGNAWSAMQQISSMIHFNWEIKVCFRFVHVQVTINLNPVSKVKHLGVSPSFSYFFPYHLYSKFEVRINYYYINYDDIGQIVIAVQ